MGARIVDLGHRLGIPSLGIGDDEELSTGCDWQDRADLFGAQAFALAMAALAAAAMVIAISAAYELLLNAASPPLSGHVLMTPAAALFGLGAEAALRKMRIEHQHSALDAPSRRVEAMAALLAVAVLQLGLFLVPPAGI